MIAEAPTGSPTSFSARCSRRVSYIMATKDRPAQLATALEHAKSYMRGGDELIVISGSADSAEYEIVRQAGVVDIYVREPDRSGTEAANKGVLLARGRYVKFAPDDDAFHSDGLEVVYAAMDADPDLGVLVGGGTKVWVGHDASAISCVPDGVPYGQTVDPFFQYGATGVGSVWRRTAFARAGLFAPVWLLSDFEQVVRCMKSGVKVRACRANTYTHPVYPYSALMRDKERVKKEAGQLKALYGASAYIEPGKVVTNPVWDGRVV